MSSIKPDFFEDQVSPEFVDAVIKYIDDSELDKTSYDYYLSIVEQQFNLEGQEAKDKLEELNNSYEGQVRSGKPVVPIPTLRFKHWNFHKEENDIERMISNTMYKKSVSANNVYGFDLDFNHMTCFLAKYMPEENAHFDWHVDGHMTFQDPSSRKLSFTVCLKPAKKGGKFFIQEGWEVWPKSTDITSLTLPIQEIEQTPGKVISFPSYYNHCVTPVEEGNRYVLITWIWGPEWR